MAKRKRVERGRGWELIRPCPRCGAPPAACRCPAPAPDRAPRPIIRLEKRKGRPVTVVSGLGLDPASLRDLAALWKRKLGAGGTVRGEELEVQGDRRKELRALLADLKR